MAQNKKCKPFNAYHLRAKGLPAASAGGCQFCGSGGAVKLRSIIVAMKGGGEERGRVSGVVCKMRGWQKKSKFLWCQISEP